MKRSRRFAAVVGVVAVLLSGCGKTENTDTVEETTVVVAKSGEINFHLVEPFDKDYYELNELRQMATQEADAYNKTNATGEGQPVTVASVEMLAGKPGNVKVGYVFEDSTAFSDFAGSFLFFGTVNEAVNRDLKMDTTLYSIKGDIDLTEELLKTEKDRRILITDAKAVIICPGKVTHLSDNAGLREDGSVDASKAEGMVYILLK